jgi:hypothetical protein
MDTGSLLGVKAAGVLTTHPYLVPRFKEKSRAIPLFSLRGLQGL